MFIELGLPKRGFTTPKFYVCDDNHEHFLYNNGNGVDDGNGLYNQYLFDTEADAHKAAKEYYKVNNRVYPYPGAYWHALKEEANKTLTSLSESQVMEFE